MGGTDLALRLQAVENATTAAISTLIHGHVDRGIGIEAVLAEMTVLGLWVGDMRKRPSARLLVLDANNHVLLFRFEFQDGALAGKAYWATPGGALEEGEDYPDAAKRELREETGITTPVLAQVGQRSTTFQTPDGGYVEADERYFLVRVNDQQIDKSGQSALEARYMTKHKWWSREDLTMTDETVFPDGLLGMIEAQSQESC